jgi:hypothetical protein
MGVAGRGEGKGMINYITFWGYMAIVMIISFFFAYFLFPPRNFGFPIRITIGICVALIVTFSVFGNMMDTAVISETAISSNVSSKIIGSYDGGMFLFVFPDHSIKLENGKILKFDDPYTWKQFKEGNYYNYTKNEAFSYLQGNVTFYDYTYKGVI